MSQINLEEQINELEQEIECLKSINDVQNCVGRYEYYHQPVTMAKTPEVFALNTPDVSRTVYIGTYVGGAKVKELYEHALNEKPVGSMMEHPLSTPVIEVAKDGKTAKAVWFSPGHETIPEFSPYGYWSWARCAGDFIKENGQWKIWHWQFYPTFRPKCTESWVKEADYIPMDNRWKDSPLSRVDGNNDMYTSSTIRNAVPLPPEPYETWDGISVCESYNKFHAKDN